MKRILYIDNDRSDLAIKDVNHVKENLEYMGGIKAETLQNVEIIPDFHKIDRDEQMKLLFDGDSIILTWSMYTATHYSSLQQMILLLSAAGRNNIKGKVFVDGSGEMVSALNRTIRELKHAHQAVDIMSAIKNNFIITFDMKEYKACRIYPAFNGYKIFELSDMDIQDLFI